MDSSFLGIAFFLFGIDYSFLRIHSHDVIYYWDGGDVITPFRLSVVIGLAIAAVLVSIRRIGLSLLFVIIPLGFFCNFILTFYGRWNALFQISRDPNELGKEFASGFLYHFFSTYVDIGDYISLIVIFFLIAWYAWILVRDFRLDASRLS